MNVRIEQGWREALAAEWESPYFGKLAAWVRGEYARTRVYPPASRIFAAFDATPFEKVKAVIVGQDPYHGEGQANGLCFSVAPDVALPPSLRNIYTEILAEEGRADAPLPPDGDLSYLARQGVLLLNTTLTVEAGRAASHRGHGWERLTDAALQALAARRSGVAYLLWGAPAGAKAALIDGSRNLVLRAPHPSPLSAYRGFFGCGHFRAVNDYLVQQGKTPIKWLPEY